MARKCRREWGMGNYELRITNYPPKPPLLRGVWGGGNGEWGIERMHLYVAFQGTMARLAIKLKDLNQPRQPIQ
jgi:hypothetical protein